MEVRSNPIYPKARALCGDYAVQQNASNREYDLLNKVMDEKFKPVHQSWSNLWNTQQQLAASLALVYEARNNSDSELDGSIKSIFYYVENTVGKDSPIIKTYIPDGKLTVISLPLDEEISKMEAYAPAIAAADDTTIPEIMRTRFATALSEAKARKSDVDDAVRNHQEAQRARQTMDPDWTKAYEAYHRAVEFEMNGDRGMIAQWIMMWPESSSKGRNASETEAEAHSDADSDME